MPEISVVIPCYNGGAFLPGALASLESQTFRDFEVVVVDDGSDDAETLRLLENLQAPVRVKRQDNMGLAAARNAGMAEAKGRLLLPLDCDDALEPTFLEKARAALDDSGADFAFAHLRMVGDKEGVLEKGYNRFTQLFLNQLPYSLLMRREIWEGVGGYDETMRRGYEDWEFNIRLGGAGRAGVAVPEPLFVYRVSASGMLQSLSNRLHAQLWRDIQHRNPALYRLPALLAARREWKDAPRAYPAWMLFGLLAIHKVLPTALFNRVFSSAMRFSQSSRVGG